MSSVNLIPSKIQSTSSPSWTFTGNPCASGSMSILPSYGVSGEAVAYLYGLSSGIPLDSVITGISLSLTPSSTGTLSGSISVGIGFLQSFTGPLTYGAEKTIGVAGSGGMVVTFGGSGDLWQRPLWSRAQFCYGSPGALGFSIRRSGTPQLTISNVVITVYYTLSSNLTGSRAPIPGDPIAVPDVFPLKSDGTGDLSAITSSEVNKLGDALYNLELNSVNASQPSNTVYVYGGAAGQSLILGSVYVSGFVSDFNNDVVYDEVVGSNGSTIFSSGVSSLYRTMPSIPDNTAVYFDVIGGQSWLVGSDGTVVPTEISFGGFAIQNTDGVQYQRLSFRVAGDTGVGIADTLSAGNYFGLLTKNVGPGSSLNKYTLFPIQPIGTNGSPNITGLGSTYQGANNYSSSGSPQPFVIANYTESAISTVQAIRFQAKDPTVGNKVASGVKKTLSNGVFDCLEFEVQQSTNYDVSGSGYVDTQRCGAFLYGSDSSSGINGYGVLFSKGDATAAPHGVLWLVKLNNLEPKNAVLYTYTTAATGYLAFPWPVGNSTLQNIGVQPYVLTDNHSLTNPANVKKLRLVAQAASGNVVLSLQEFSPTTNTFATVLSTTDSSSPYIPSGSAVSGLYQIAPTIPLTYGLPANSFFDLVNLNFGFVSAPSVGAVQFHARIAAFGRLQ